MHLRPVKYTAAIGGEGEPPLAATGGRSMRLPATLFDGNNNNSERNPSFTVKQCLPLQRATLLSHIEQVSSQSNDNDNTSSGSSSSSSSSSETCIRSLPIRHFNNVNYNNILSKSNFSNAFLSANGAALSKTETNLSYDKMKLMELSIINLVESSCLAAEVGNFKGALMKSKEALDKLASMRSIVLQMRTSIADGQPAPVTTGVRFVELALMVNCNLATQLKNDGNLERSVELYSQITKLAGSSASAMSQSNLLLLGGQQIQGDAKFLLYRFGLNIGNLLFAMKDYQRALKYYRLTLDRLSSAWSSSSSSLLSNQTGLRIKLMNNISLTLLAMREENEAINSMNLLLAENLSQQQMVALNEQQQQQQQQQQHAKSRQSGESSSTNCEAYNGNHDRFALNLIVCYHKRHDSASIVNILKALIRADICHQYERVLDCTKFNKLKRQQQASSRHTDDNHTDDGQQNSRRQRRESGRLPVEGNETSFAQADQNIQLDLSGSTIFQAHHDNSEAKSKAWHNMDDQLFSASPELSTNNKSKRDVALSRGGQVSSLIGSKSTPTTWSSSRAAGKEQEESIESVVFVCSLTRPSKADKLRQVMKSIQEDRLERLIGAREKQISRSILLGCNLLLDLYYNSFNKNNESHEIRSNSRRQAKQSADEMDNNSDNKHPVWPATTTSVYELCLDLLATSSRYKSLACDLKVNKMIRLLGKRYKLNEAVALFKEISAQEWHDHDRDVDQQRAVSGGGKKQLDRSTSSHLHSGEATTISKTHIPVQSPATVVNKVLICLLLKQYAKAIEITENVSENLAESLVNQANCLFNLGQIDEADLRYQQAIKLDPTCWEAHYNFAILCRKINRNYNNLLSSSKSVLAKDRQIFSLSLANRNMNLSAIQSALIFMQSGNEKQAISILKDILTNSRQAPEVHLLISKLVGEESLFEQAQVVLQQAHHENPYHLGVLERLIVLKIRAFDYNSAKQLLVLCIKNRPNQVKWYQMLAECHRRAAEYNKAINVYKTAIATFPQETSCLKALIKLTGDNLHLHLKYTAGEIGVITVGQEMYLYNALKHAFAAFSTTITPVRGVKTLRLRVNSTSSETILSTIKEQVAVKLLYFIVQFTKWSK